MKHFLFSILLATACCAAETRRPNIIFIMADDLGTFEVGCYGQKKIRTPHIDRMAGEGMRFTQFYSGSPVCAPSRCTLLTGLYTGHCSIRDNGELPNQEGQRAIPANTFTIGRLLQQQGYVTGVFGKWGLGGPGSTGEPNRQGFDRWFGYLCQREAHNYYPTHLWRDGKRVDLEGNEGGKQLVGKQYSHDLIANEALQFIRDNKSKPFFLYVPFTIPHLALQVPEDSLNEYRGRFDEIPYTGTNGYLPHPTPRAAYAAMITRMDRDVGRILALVKELGLDEQTLVIFASDNGPTIRVGGADSKFFGSAGPLRGLKQDVYEGGIRIPFIARWPGQIKAGTTNDFVGALWDVMPTVAELTGAKTPRDIDGISFFPTLLGRSGQKQHDHLYWEYHSQGARQAVRIGDWKGLRNDVIRNPNGPIELYNLKDDPSESNDVAAGHPAIVKRVREIMARRTPSDNPRWNFAPLANARSIEGANSRKPQRR
jgi:arylsulfatase A